MRPLRADGRGATYARIIALDLVVQAEQQAKQGYSSRGGSSTGHCRLPRAVGDKTGSSCVERYSASGEPADLHSEAVVDLPPMVVARSGPGQDAGAARTALAASRRFLIIGFGSPLRLTRTTRLGGAPSTGTVTR